MKIKSLLLASNNNIIIQNVAENGTVTVNTIELKDFLAQYTQELQERISELQKSLERSEELFKYKKEELSKEINHLNLQIKEREDRIKNIILQYKDKDISQLSDDYQKAFTLFFEGKLKEALLLLNDSVLQESEKQQAETRILKGQILFLRNKFPEAEKNFIRATAIYPSEENFYALACFYHNTKKHKNACKYFQKAINCSTNDVHKAQSLKGLGMEYIDLENIEKAELYTKKAIDILIRLSNNGELLPCLESLDIYCSLALIAHEKGNYPEAEKLYREALKAQKELLVEFNDNSIRQAYANTMHNLARVLTDNHQFDEAENLFSEVIISRQKLAKEKPEEILPDLAETYLYYGNLLLHKKEYTSAEKLYNQALFIHKQAKDEGHYFNTESHFQTLYSLGVLHWQTNNRQEAEKRILESIEILQNQIHDKPSLYLPKEAFAYYALGKDNHESNDLEKAIHYYEKCLSVISKLKFKKIDEYAWMERDTLFCLGNITATIFPEKSERYYTQALKLQYALLKENADHKELNQLANILYNIGRMYGQNQKTDLAINYLSEALTIFRSLPTNNPNDILPITSNILDILGTLSTNNNEIEKAENYFTEAIEIQRNLAAGGSDKNIIALAISLYHLGSFLQMCSRNPQTALKYANESLALLYQYKENPQTQKWIKFNQDLISKLEIGQTDFE